MKTNRHHFVLIGVLALVGAVAAQTPEPASIEGLVTLAGSGDPVISAAVSFTNATGGERRAITGPDGKFTARALLPGVYKINVTKPGFLKPSDGFGTAEVNVMPGQRMTGMVLHLIKGGVIAGRYTDQSRNPRSNVRVDAMRYRYVNGQRNVGIVATTITNDRGEYRFAGLDPGEYIIAVVAMIDRSETLPPTFYPGVGDARTAVVIPLTAGMEAGGINFSANADTTRSVTVRVVLPPTHSGQLVFVSLINSGNTGALALASLSQPNNRDAYVFEKVRPGSYVLNARVSEGLDSSEASRPLYASTTVVVSDEDVDAGTLSLQLGYPVTGRIVSSAQLLASLKMQQLRVLLFVLEGPLLGRPAPIPVNEDGTFQIMNLPKGAYRVSLASLPEALFLDSLSYAARTVPDLRFNLETQPVGPLELRVEGPAGRVQGVVRNAVNGPVSGGQVVLIPPAERRGNPDLFRTGTTDANGSFTIAGVVPGDYQVLAWQKVEPGAFQDPEYVRRFDAQSVKIPVGRGTTNDLTLRVIPSTP